MANSVVGLIRRSFSYLDKHTFRKLYSAFVRPHLEYAQCVWSPKSRKCIDIIENVQKRATKLVDGLGNIDYMERLKILDLPTLVYRRARGDMIEMFKHFDVYQRGLLSPSFNPKIRPSRQHDYQLHESRPKDGVRGVHCKAFYQRATPIWNGLPKEVVDSKSLNIFKNNLDKAWLDKQHMER